METEKKILIVDDVEINRAILADIFSEDYGILEAGSGAEAIEIMRDGADIAAVLLDLLMPGVNGLGVLTEMNESGRIKEVPVFLITAAESEELLMEAYRLGAVDVISKPFLRHFLRHRINNVIELYQHRNRLEAIVREQVERLDRVNRSMVEALAAVIEFRDGESGEHVKRICGLTRILMRKVSDKYPEYRLSDDEIEKVVTSSVLHDVGKISIPDAILCKPGKLTPEEFEVMKQHTVRGCGILESMEDIVDPAIYRYSYDICRHHHERWDGRGYPDGLVGDEIPIWAQVVSVADVYDALTEERVYKKAFPHEKAVDMIFKGECGAFNPKVLSAFDEVKEEARGREKGVEKR